MNFALNKSTMLLQNQVIQVLLLLIPFWIDISLGQIVFEDNIRSSPGMICITPDGGRGNCMRWTKCPSLKQKLTWDELKPFLCGFAGTEPNICCPSSSPPDIPVSSTERIPPINNNPRTENKTSNRTPILTLPKPKPPGNRRNPPINNNSRTENKTSNRTPIFTLPKPKPPGNSGNPKNSNILPVECGVSAFIDNRVIGGREADKGSWPWMAVIFIVKRSGSKSSDCGGALVTAKHVVTAAHCVVRRYSIAPIDPQRLLVRLGAHDLSNDNETEAIDINVDNVQLHERYDPRVHTNDIAVLRLTQLVEFSKSISPVCLPYDSLRYDDLSGKSSTTIGFGLTSVNGSYSNVLMEVSFDVQDQEECMETYANDIPIIDGHLCAGTLDGSKDTCQGDSGGPLMTVGENKRFYLIGVVSFGKKCALVGYTGVYTRVTAYLDWLTPNLGD